MGADTKRYTAAWAKIQSVDGAATARAKLESVVADLEQSRKSTQRFGSPVTIMNEDPTSSVMGCLREGDRVYLQCASDTVDLIVEASECFPHFEALVQDLGVRTDAANCSTNRKTLQRAAEKVARSYLDWSHVTDLVRASLVYSTMPGLIAAVQALMGTPGVEILRVKNRFSERYDADRHTGYRDLLVNLRVAASQHVCELQFNLNAMYTLKTGTGHKQYVQYRNVMME
jgi:hypothetical protein